MRGRLSLGVFRRPNCRGRAMVLGAPNAECHVVTLRRQRNWRLKRTALWPSLVVEGQRAATAPVFVARCAQRVAAR